MNLYDIKIDSLQGKPIKLSDFKNKFILFVNVASKCGFTPQYKDLETLSETYKDSLVVIGVPCNQFGKQEPGSADEIQEFCEVNYGVSFLMTEKIDVKGDDHQTLKIKEMFNLFKKKSEVEKLQDAYKKLMEEAYKLQSVSRSDSDKKYFEADEILKKIEEIQKK